MKVSFITLGCRVNHYESEALREKLKEAGVAGASRGERADVCVINTCAVTEESVRKSRQAVRRAVKLSPGGMICVMGCASQLYPDDFSDIPGVSFVCGTRNRNETFEAIKSFAETGVPVCGTVVVPPSGGVEPMRISTFDRTRAYVKIEDGCNGKCSYCVIKDVRGPVAVRGRDEILSEVGALARAGCREVVLTGIETAAYGKDLPELIKDVALTEGIERIRLGSMEPSFMTKSFIDEVAGVWKFCPHFHVSVQSGSDRILSLMRRKYNSRVMRENLGYALNKIPGLCLTADLIVGFPTETEEDFGMTADLVRDLGLLHCHIFRYSKRPGTEAALMGGQVPAAVSGERAARLHEIAREEKLRALGRILSAESAKVLCERRADGFITGHTENFAECRFEPSGRFFRGRVAEVKLTGIDAENGMLTGDEKAEETE